MTTLLLVALLQPKLEPTIDFIDSRDDKEITYIIVNNTCKIKVKKADLKNYDKVIDIIMEKCGL